MSFVRNELWRGTRARVEAVPHRRHVGRVLCRDRRIAGKHCGRVAAS